MNHKKLVYIFLVIAMSFTLVLPALNLYFTAKNTKINLNDLTKQQLFSTDNFESLVNYFVYKTFNFSLNERQVIAGKDNFFFLGNGFVRIIDKTEGTFPYTNKDIEIWSRKLKQLQEWYTQQGIEFIIVIAPNKHTIYNDKLPKDIVYKESGTITDDMVKSSLTKDIHIFNLKKVLREKKEKQLYFHADTHWNNYGAHIGYVNSMKYLNMKYRKNYIMADYSINESTLNGGGGDLTNFLKINQFLLNKKEKNYNFIFKQKRQVCYGEITMENKLNKCTKGIKNKFNHYVINKNAPNKEKLLYMSDSFGLANSKLYEETFNTVWRFHLSYTHGSFLPNFINENKPDIVIYQVVERDLGNNTIIDDIPKINKNSRQ